MNASRKRDRGHLLYPFLIWNHILYISNFVSIYLFVFIFHFILSTFRLLEEKRELLRREAEQKKEENDKQAVSAVSLKDKEEPVKEQEHKETQTEAEVSLCWCSGVGSAGVAVVGWYCFALN